MANPDKRCPIPHIITIKETAEQFQYALVMHHILLFMFIKDKNN
jgi:hypothetical protein